jgi:hypothetical protein
MITFRRLAPLMLGVALVGCHDDATGPDSAFDLRVAALSFDALVESRMSAGDGGGAAASRIAALALRTGVRPARVRITVDGVAQDYWALETEHALVPNVTKDDFMPTLPPVSRTMVAWRGGPAERVISIMMSGDTGTFSWERYELTQLPAPYPFSIDRAFGIMFERGGPVHFSVDGGARSTRQAIGAECKLPEPRPIIAIYPSPPMPVSCHAARFFTRFNMRVQEGPPAGAAAVRARVVSMDGQDIPGIRLEYRWVYEPCPVCD